MNMENDIQTTAAATAAALTSAAIGGTWQDTLAAIAAHDHAAEYGSEEGIDHDRLAFWLDQIVMIPSNLELINVQKLAAENAKNDLPYYSDISEILENATTAEASKAEAQLEKNGGLFDGYTTILEASRAVAAQIVTNRNAAQLVEVVEYLKSLSND